MNVSPKLEDINEEFNNFMHRVNEVNRIVKKLGSGDTETQNMGMAEANQYLNDDKEALVDKLCEDTIKLNVKSNKTIINRKALMQDDGDQGTMSQEAFMEHVSKDADKRYKEKLIRQEKADTFKTRATKAFRRGEYAKALTLYDKAIELIKDSCMLYINRSLAQMHLQRYDKAIADAEKALYWNENSLKARLLLAKYHFISSNMKEFRNAINEAKERHKEKIQIIEDYVNELLNDDTNSKLVD